MSERSLAKLPRDGDVPATSSALPSPAGTHAPKIMRIEDVDEALVVDCFTPSRRDVLTILGGIAASEVVLFAVLQQAVALHPLATAATLVVAAAAGVGLLRRAEAKARFGLGAQLVARGVAPEVASELAVAERRLGWRFHLRGKHERARMLLGEARRALDDDGPNRDPRGR